MEALGVLKGNKEERSEEALSKAGHIRDDSVTMFQTAYQIRSPIPLIGMVTLEAKLKELGLI